MTTFPLLGALALPLALVLCGGCSGTTSSDDSSDGSGAEGPDLNECAPSDYVDLSAEGADRIIDVSTITAFNYTPACVIIKAGQTVRWEGSLAQHPIEPGDAVADSPANPIVTTSSGESVEFTFPAAGSYAYFCEFHGGPDGTGMAGLIHVVD